MEKARIYTIVGVLLTAIIFMGGIGFATKCYLDSRPVAFNDPALEQAVYASTGYDRPITHKEAREIVSLDLSLMEGYSKEITDLAGLSSFSNLKKLNLANNMITDISELGKLKKLEMLHLEGNEISDVSGLASLVKLEFLDLEGNKVSDISALRRLKALSVLDLRGNMYREQ